MAAPTQAPQAPGKGEGSSDRRQRAFHSAKDYETSASQLGDVLAPDPCAKTKARKVVAEQIIGQRGEDKEALIETLMMLGIHPDQPDWDELPSIQPSHPKGM